jgi:PEP-CTERM motif
MLEHNRGVNPKSGRVIMNKSRSSSFRASAAAIASIGGSLLVTTALATTMNPQPLTAGGTVSVPVYGSSAGNHQSSPTGTGLAWCAGSSCGTGQLTLLEIASELDGSLLEIAGTTNLNPFGADDVTFAFAIGNEPPVASVELPGFSTWSTDVQGCDPNLSIPCPSTDSGANATRDLTGDITFSATAATGLPTQTVSFLNVTDVYAVYTNAPVSALAGDPDALVTFIDGSTESFAALSLTAPTTTGAVPEPSMLGLLAAGLATLGLGMGLRRRSSR